MHLSKLRSGKGWRVIVQHGGRKLSGSGPTKAAAQQVGANLLLELGAVPKAQPGVTLAALLDEHLRTKKMSPAARYDFGLIVHKLPVWVLAAPVGDVDPFTVERWYQRLAADGWTVHRLRKLHTLLRSAFKRAAAWRWCTSNPVISATPPAAPDTEMEPPDAALTGRLLRAADLYGLNPDGTRIPGTTDAFGVYIRVSANTGARRGEVCALQWGDVDLELGVLVVRRSVSYVAGVDGPVISATKTGSKGHRAIGLGAGTVTALTAHQDRTEKVSAERGVPLGPGSWVFTHDGRAPWRPDYASRAWGEVRRTVTGAETMKLHALRHAVATRLLAGGMDPKTVAGRLGHSNPSTTLKTYAAFVPARDRAAADMLEEGLD